MKRKSLKHFRTDGSIAVVIFINPELKGWGQVNATLTEVSGNFKMGLN